MNKREKLERRRRLREAKAKGPKPNYTGPNRGMNPPRDVLAFIELRLRMSEQRQDPIELARELGYDDAGIARLKVKHPDDMLRYLQGVERSRRDSDRFLAKQNGRSHPEQYVESHIGAVDELPAVPKHYEDTLASQRLSGAEELLRGMVEMERALRFRLTNSEAPMVEGELKRALRQVERARVKAERKLAVYEQERRKAA